MLLLFNNLFIITCTPPVLLCCLFITLIVYASSFSMMMLLIVIKVVVLLRNEDEYGDQINSCPFPSFLQRIMSARSFTVVDHLFINDGVDCYMCIHIGTICS